MFLLCLDEAKSDCCCNKITTFTGGTKLAWAENKTEDRNKISSDSEVGEVSLSLCLLGESQLV